MTTDLHTAASAFVGVMIAEALVKPIALRLGRYVIRKLDDKITIIPDWLR